MTLRIFSSASDTQIVMHRLCTALNCSMTEPGATELIAWMAKAEVQARLVNIGAIQSPRCMCKGLSGCSCSWKLPDPLSGLVHHFRLTELPRGIRVILLGISCVPATEVPKLAYFGPYVHSFFYEGQDCEAVINSDDGLKGFTRAHFIPGFDFGSAITVIEDRGLSTYIDMETGHRVGQSEGTGYVLDYEIGDHLGSPCMWARIQLTVKAAEWVASHFQP